jgi:hypothetical protein
MREAALAVSFLLLSHAARLNAVEPVTCVEDLACMGCAQLEQIYREAEPGRVPNGFAPGRVVYCADGLLAGAKSGMAHVLWRGKHFCDDGTLVNQWLGLRAIHATVAFGPSWLDGKTSIILDYGDTSRVWSDVRDEMREVSPGVYLGAMYLRRCPEPRLKLYFILRACDAAP